jgi:hypothetical protein
VGLFDRLLRREPRICSTCSCALIPSTVPTLTGRVRSIVVELSDVPVLRCPAGHDIVVRHGVTSDDLLLAAVGEEQVPTAIIRPLGAPLCLSCGGRLETVHVVQCTRAYAMSLGDGNVQQMRVTGPHMQCTHCGAWQLYCADMGASLVRAIRKALKPDPNAVCASTRQSE